MTEDNELLLPGEVERQAQALRVRREARSIVDAEGWTPPPTFASAAGQMRNPLPSPRFVVDRLIPAGSNVSIQAQWKAGKTTLGFNLAADLVDGEPFVGEFATSRPRGRRVAYWNFEVSGATAQNWLRDMEIRNLARLYVEHWRGQPMPITTPHVEEWCVEYLRSRKVGVWVIDPFGAVYNGEENSNSEVNAWLQAVNRIKERAGVSVVVLIVHTGHGTAGEDGLPRARGASALLGWPDVLITYRHDGEIGTAPRGTTRYLGAFGRDVSVGEVVLDYDADTRRLRVEAGRTRAEVRSEGLKKRAADVVMEAAAHDECPLTATELQSRMGGKNGGPKTRAIREAVRSGWITETSAGAQKKLYTPGPTPYSEPKIRLVKAAEEVSESA